VIEHRTAQPTVLGGDARQPLRPWPPLRDVNPVPLVAQGRREIYHCLRQLASKIRLSSGKFQEYTKTTGIENHAFRSQSIQSDWNREGLNSV
jgi:hypothetical protein